MKRFMALALCFLLAFGGMTACAEEASVYRTLYSGEINSLNYLTTSSTNEFSVAANVIDTLVEYDKYGQVQPSLAESWTTSEDGLVWTFKLREDATWVDYSGAYYANVTANDFVAAAGIF